MEVLTKYKAVDGKEFTNKSDCLSHEDKIRLVGEVSKLIPSKPSGCGFSNGEGFIQHAKDSIGEYRKGLLLIYKEIDDHKWIHQNINDETIDPSWIARLLSECNIGALRDAWYRLSCMDSNLREFGQPYYAKHPEQAKLICLNP